MMNPYDAVYAASCEPAGSARCYMAETICRLRGVEPGQFVLNGFGQTWEQWRSVLAELLLLSMVIHN